MRRGNRDEFSAKTRRRLAERASFRCSICNTPTIGPSAESNDAISTSGRASHICAAARKGPRHRDMTVEERCGIENGIWLCAKHGDLVDDDKVKYTEEELLAYKRVHEERVAREHEGQQQTSVSYERRGSALLAFEVWREAFRPELSAWDARYAWDGYSVRIPLSLLQRCADAVECISDDVAASALRHGLSDSLTQFDMVAVDLLHLVALTNSETNGGKYLRMFQASQGNGDFLYLVDVDELDPSIDRSDWIESEKCLVRMVLYQIVGAANRVILEANNLDLFSPPVPYANPDLPQPPLPTEPYLGLEQTRHLAHHAESGPERSNVVPRGSLTTHGRWE